jgi:hypothetical protein
MKINLIIYVASILNIAFSDNMFSYQSPKTPPTDMKDLINFTTSTGGPYTYSQSHHHFSGTAYDGTWIDTTGCCSGQSGSCRNNPSCQCQKSVGPLPQGTYSLGNMFTYKGMPYCYELYPSSSNNMCGRSGFLIHGGDCSGNPSEGCIVIQDQNTRYRIKSGATLKVVS